jgi:hypothetical protein
MIFRESKYLIIHSFQVAANTGWWLWFSLRAVLSGYQKGLITQVAYYFL